MGKSSRRGDFEAGKGTPGFFRQDQKVQKFADRRTRRDRDRSSQNRNAIRQSQREN